MSQAVQQVAWGLQHNLIHENDIDEHLIGKCLYTRHSPCPDLLIRTSGEVRMSDFLLWQTAYTAIYFTSVLWPEFSLKDLCLAILHYQRNLPVIKVKRCFFQFWRILVCISSLLWSSKITYNVRWQQIMNWQCFIVLPAQLDVSKL